MCMLHWQVAKGVRKSFIFERVSVQKVYQPVDLIQNIICQLTRNPNDSSVLSAIGSGVVSDAIVLSRIHFGDQYTFLLLAHFLHAFACSYRLVH